MYSLFQRIMKSLLNVFMCVELICETDYVKTAYAGNSSRLTP